MRAVVFREWQTFPSISVGEAFFVYGPVGCGHCKMCGQLTGEPS
jgi:hypothetical protein